MSERRSPWAALAATTTLLATSIAAGPVTGIVPVAVCSLAWFASVGYVAVAAVRAGPRGPVDWIFAAGVAAAALRMSALGWVQLVGDRQALFWNVDWRYHATQAQGIARFRGVTDSLDYAGEAVQYHAGPSWIAGSLHATLGLPINAVLFLLVPLACVVVVGVGARRLLVALGAAAPAASIAVAVALNLPANPYSFARRLAGGELGVAIEAEAWSFTAVLMLNSLLALAVGFVGLALLVSARTPARAAVGGLCFASVVALKPQYIVGFAAATAIGYLLAGRSGAGGPRSRATVVGALAALVGGGVIFLAINEQATQFTGVELVAPDPLDLVRTHSLLMIAAVVVAVTVLVRSARPPSATLLLAAAVGAAAGALALLAVVDSTVFLLDADQIAQARAVGLEFERSWQDFNVTQVMVPATLVVVLLAVALLAARGAAASRRQNVFPWGAVAVVALTLPYAISALAEPTGRSAPEWTEERALDALMDEVRPDDGVWLSSDLADPAEDFARPLIAAHLTALGPAQHYLSNVPYSGWTRADVVERVEDVERFFASDWSPWHDRFLAEQEVRFVLVRDRCPAAWDASEFPGRVVGAADGWTLLEAGASGGTAAGESAEPSWPEPTDDPAYGLSACRSGAREG
ncbi:MAG: hypothetical protein ABL966_09720 [Acidimicrobiales bacterium]